jgi:hypothetical protein
VLQLELELVQELELEDSFVLDRDFGFYWGTT